MQKFFKNLFDPSRKILQAGAQQVPAVKEFKAKYKDVDNAGLRARIDEIRNELKAINTQIPDEERSSIRMRRKLDKFHPAEAELYKRVQELLPEAFALLTTQTKRKYGKEHFDVQLQAGFILASGQKLVEMKTGEGKTMTFQLPLFAYGLTGRGAHLVTVNDYLARRDGEYAGHAFAELGLSVGVITPQASYRFVNDADLATEKGEDAVKARAEITAIEMSQMTGVNLKEVPKHEAYMCDVVYGTNNEFGFDYLRDNMARSLARTVQRELYFCVVDEADSILIDEARTPLIISAPASESTDLYGKFSLLVEQLKEGDDYVKEERERAVNLTDAGIEKMENLLGVTNIWEDYQLAHHLENALKARVYFERDKNYIVRGGEVLIVDEFTGRVLAGRRYSEGLHQAIEAKEGVKIQQESRTLATITFQNFFRIYKVLAGGSGTIITEQEEFFKIYNLEAAEVPTNKPLVRKDEQDRIYRDRGAKFAAVVSEIQEANQSGQPVLVGTTSIADSEYLSDLLTAANVTHQVLNAKHHEQEAQIVARAGDKGAVTVATNMAGRGTDIPLAKGVTDVGGLYVIGTERHESRRIDNQLRGRSGRQGDAGKTRFYVALDDQIMRVQGGDTVKRLLELGNLPVDLPLESRLITGSIERAQKRMEGMYFDTRKSVVEYDDVINQQREIFYSRRRRYLEFIAAYDKAFAEKDSEARNTKLAQIKADIENQFQDVVNYEAKSMAAEIVLASDKAKQSEQASQIAARLLSFAPDSLFITVVDNLKLTELQGADSGIALQEKLRTELIRIRNDRPALEELFTRLLRAVLHQKLQQLTNVAGLIRATFLEVMDELWTRHLDHMQDIREGVGLRGIAQLDPLVEYKNEGFIAFKQFIERINKEALLSLLNVDSTVVNNEQIENPLLGSATTNLREIQEILSGRENVSNGSNTDGKVAGKRNATNSKQGLSKAAKKKRRR